MILLIAFRNLLTQLKHTLIILSLTGLMIMLFFIGNTVIGTSAEGLRRTYNLNYTGDVVIQETTDGSMSLFGSNNPAIGDYFGIPVLKGYEEVHALVAGLNGVAVFTPQISGPVALTVDGKHYPSIAFGIDAETYFSAFPSISLREGAKLKPGQQGAMITKERAERIESDIGRRLVPGEPLLFTTAGETGFKIREVPLVGVFSYANAGQVPVEITLLDAQTARALNAVLLAQTNAEKPPAGATDLLTDDVDDLFSEPNARRPNPAGKSGASVSLSDLRAEITHPRPQKTEAWSGGGWNFIVIRLKPGVSGRTFIDGLNARLAPLGARAVDWTTAAGPPALLVSALFYLFNGGLILLVLATVIAVINVVLISVFQRVREIGTLRAIGASNSFIVGMVFSENLIIALAAGVLGVLAGAAVLAAVNALDLRVSNDLLTVMLGGNTAHFAFDWSVAAAGVLLALVLGGASSLYPVGFALRVQPSEAVAKG